MRVSSIIWIAEKMNAKSPPRHRHDGTSPLPLGMDWSPPPRKWTGRDTIWPHDPRTGWSFCVMIPSWVGLPEARTANGTLINPTVFYRVQVGIQSPNGITTIYGILRRFSDFLKLSAALKRTFPKKRLPPAPPKHSFLRINSSQPLLQERRCALEEWMGKLLSDIDISRSAPVASFLELEAAARAAITEISEAQQSSSTNVPVNCFKSSFHLNPGSGPSQTIGGSSIAFGVPPSTPEYGSDVVYEASDLGTPRAGRDHDFDIEIEDVTAEEEIIGSGGAMMKNGLFEVEQQGLPSVCSRLPEGEAAGRTSLSINKEVGFIDGDSVSGEIIKDAVLSGTKYECMHETESEQQSWHGRKLSVESITSEISSVRGSEISNVGTANSLNDNLVWLRGGVEHSADDLGITDLHFPRDIQAVLPLHQRGKLQRVLMSLQRRLLTTKADMEDLIARLNQEVAVKDFLMTKVKDLEGELDNAKHKSRETLQQAVLLEREQVTQLQWDLEELRRKALESEDKFKLEQVARVHAETRMQLAESEKESLELEVSELREKIQNLQKDHDSVEAKAKADMKVLAKEVKLLRKSQPELKRELHYALEAKSELQMMLQKERQKQEQASAARVKLLHEVGILRKRLQECSVDFLAKEEDKYAASSSSLSDAVELLTTADNRIGLLLAEAQLLAHEKEDTIEIEEKVAARQAHDGCHANGKESRIEESNNAESMEAAGSEAAVRKMLTDIFIDNAQLRKALNSFTRSALLTEQKPEKDAEDDTPPRRSVLNRFLEI